MRMLASIIIIFNLIFSFSTTQALGAEKSEGNQDYTSLSEARHNLPSPGPFPGLVLPDKKQKEIAVLLSNNGIHVSPLSQEAQNAVSTILKNDTKSTKLDNHLHGYLDDGTCKETYYFAKYALVWCVTTQPDGKEKNWFFKYRQNLLSD